MYRAIIREKIKQNRRYVGNEDLLESFENMVYERLDGILDTILDEQVRQSIIIRTVSKSILDVLKINKRISKCSKVETWKNDYKNLNLDIPFDSQEGYSLMKLKQLYTLLKKIDEKEKSGVLNLVNLRYANKLNISEIAEKLDLSELEVSELLFELSDYSSKVELL